MKIEECIDENVRYQIVIICLILLLLVATTFNLVMKLRGFLLTMFSQEAHTTMKEDRYKLTTETSLHLHCLCKTSSKHATTIRLCGVCVCVSV